MSQISTPHYLINGPFGIYGPGWPNGAPPALGFQPPPGLGGTWVRNSPIPGTNVSLGSTLYNPNGQATAWTQGFRTQPSPTQTPSQARQSEQPAPKQPASTPSPTGGNYGYGSQGAYTAPPTPILAGAPPQGPTYTPPPQPLSVASAPAAPSLVNAQARSVTAQSPVVAPAVGSGQTIMSTPPMNPLHAEIQRQMANNTTGGFFNIPYDTDQLNRRYPGYQTT